MPPHSAKDNRWFRSHPVPQSSVPHRSVAVKHPLPPCSQQETMAKPMDNTFFAGSEASLGMISVHPQVIGAKPGPETVGVKHLLPLGSQQEAANTLFAGSEATLDMISACSGITGAAPSPETVGVKHPLPACSQQKAKPNPMDNTFFAGSAASLGMISTYPGVIGAAPSPEAIGVKHPLPPYSQQQSLSKPMTNIVFAEGEERVNVANPSAGKAGPLPIPTELFDGHWKTKQVSTFPLKTPKSQVSTLSGVNPCQWISTTCISIRRPA